MKTTPATRTKKMTPKQLEDLRRSLAVVRSRVSRYSSEVRRSLGVRARRRVLGAWN